MTEQFEEMMQKTARNINVGYLSALFDTAVESIAKIAVDERISGAIHKAINPMLDKMIDELHSMKNNTMATIMLANDEKMKVIQSTRADIIRSLYCDTCANKEDVHRCEVCVMLPGFDSRATRPSEWKPADCENDCENESESRTPARDRAIGVHCRFTNIVGKQCLVCGYSEIIENRPAYVVCNKLQMEIPCNYTCDKFDRYGQESE